jgi:hypothetical protein
VQDDIKITSIEASDGTPIIIRRSSRDVSCQGLQCNRGRQLGRHLLQSSPTSFDVDAVIGVSFSFASSALEKLSFAVADGVHTLAISLPLVTVCLYFSSRTGLTLPILHTLAGTMLATLQSNGLNVTGLTVKLE